MSQMWFVNASSLPYEKRCELCDTLTNAGWEAFKGDPSYSTIKVMVETSSQAEAVKAVLPAQCVVESVVGSLDS